MTQGAAHTLVWPSLSLCGLPLQVNLNKLCPFWTSQSQCGLRDCAVKPCSPVSSSFCLPCVTRLCSLTSQWFKKKPSCLLAERGARRRPSNPLQQGESIWGSLREMNSTLQCSWIAWISSVKSCSSFLLSSNLNRFQMVFALCNQSTTCKLWWKQDVTAENWAKNHREEENREPRCC